MGKKLLALMYILPFCSPHESSSMRHINTIMNNKALAITLNNCIRNKPHPCELLDLFNWKNPANGNNIAHEFSYLHIPFKQEHPLCRDIINQQGLFNECNKDGLTPLAAALKKYSVLDEYRRITMVAGTFSGIFLVPFGISCFAGGDPLANTSVTTGIYSILLGSYIAMRSITNLERNPEQMIQLFFDRTSDQAIYSSFATMDKKQCIKNLHKISSILTPDQNERLKKILLASNTI